MLKKCSKCGLEKPLSEYYKYKTVRNGRYFTSCKSCWAKLQGHSYLKETIRKCRKCGKEFKPNSSMRWYCSEGCFTEHSRERLNKSHNKLRKEAKIRFWSTSAWLTDKYSVYNAPNGYVWAIFDNYVHIPEHRVIIMRKIGRRLESWEHIHHINGIKNDNREENLLVIDNKQHFTITMLATENKKLKERVFVLEEEVRNIKARNKLQEETHYGVNKN